MSDTDHIEPQAVARLANVLCTTIELMVEQQYEPDQAQAQLVRDECATVMDFVIDLIDQYLPQADVADTIGRVWSALSPVVDAERADWS